MSDLQLDFLGSYTAHVAAEKEAIQYGFWDDDFVLGKPPERLPRHKDIEDFFINLDYSLAKDYIGYWDSIKPNNDAEVFQRWLFAFMSVHTSWQSNIIGYQAIKNWWEWFNNWDELRDILDRSRIGMHNNRTKFISEFTHAFWKNPSTYRQAPTESWTEFRNRLRDITLGLGSAKSSFAIELCCPNTAKLTCLDTHMFQAYKLDQSKDAKRYEELERHWVEMCNMWDIPPYIARCMYWDKKQGYTDSRYWSYVFEST